MGSTPYPLGASYSATPFPYADPLICSDDTVSRGSTLTQASGSILRGTVLSYDPVAKQVSFPPAAGKANCILAADCNATAGPTPCVIYVGGIFRYTGMTFSTANDTIAAQIENLRNFAIQVESVIDVTGQRQPPSGTMMVAEKQDPKLAADAAQMHVDKAKADETTAQKQLLDAQDAVTKAQQALDKAKADEAEAQQALSEAQAAQQQEEQQKQAEADQAKAQQSGAAPPQYAQQQYQPPQPQPQGWPQQPPPNPTA